jgi:hypothetical protein
MIPPPLALSLPQTGLDPAPFLVLIGVGFVVGVAGHMVQVRAVVAVGVGLVFVGAILLIGVSGAAA